MGLSMMRLPEKKQGASPLFLVKIIYGYWDEEKAFPKAAERSPSKA
jgi:hypothetical protein